MKEASVLEIIGNNIKIARTKKGITQQELAEQLHKSNKFISMLERACSGLSLETIIDICKILDIQPNTLFNGILKYDDDKDKYITNSLSTLSNDDKDFLIDVINYVLKKNNKL